MISNVTIDNWLPPEVLAGEEAHDPWDAPIGWRPHFFLGTSWPKGRATFEHRQRDDFDRFNVYFRSIVRELREKLETMASPIAQAFAVRAYEIAGVQAIYLKSDSDRTSHFRTLVTDDDASTRDKVYDVEADIYGLFPSARIDFYVFTLGGREPSEVIPEGFALIPRNTVHATRPLVHSAGRA